MQFVPELVDDLSTPDLVVDGIGRIDLVAPGVIAFTLCVQKPMMGTRRAVPVARIVWPISRWRNAHLQVRHFLEALNRGEEHILDAEPSGTIELH